MTITETYCTDCGKVVQTETNHCPECGAEDPWKERPAYEFDPDRLPFIIEYEVYNDTYNLWRKFCSQYFGAYELNGGDVSGIPEQFPDMKYCVFTVYFVITESYDLEGPFLDKENAREVTA